MSPAWEQPYPTAQILLGTLAQVSAHLAAWPDARIQAPLAKWARLPQAETEGSEAPVGFRLHSQDTRSELAPLPDWCQAPVVLVRQELYQP